MKIAYLTGEYPRATDTFIQREVAGLRAAGVDVMTASVRRTGTEHIVGDEQAREQAQTFHVLDAAKNPVQLLGAHLSFMARSPLRWLSALALSWRAAPKGLKGRLYNLIYFLEAGVLAQQMKREGAEHLHNHIAKSSCTVAMLASEMSGIPYSFTLHGPDIFFEPHHWRLDEKIARAQFVSCISHFCRSQAMAFSDTAHWSKLHIVHCGVEPERYEGAPSLPRAKRLLFVGRLAAVKGLPVLLHALARLGDAEGRLQIVGDGPDRAALEKLTHELGLGTQVSFLGYRSQGEVAKLLAASDALILPSFAEGLPVVLMEALAAARPVIATRIAGVAELVEDGISGLLCSAGDEDGLRNALAQLVTDWDAAEAMGKAGRVTVLSEFDAKREAARLASLFEGYANNHTVALRPVPKGETK